MRVTTLDFVRTLAISLIVSGHIAQVFAHPLGETFWDLPSIYSVSLGDLGVTIFIVLSGLVLQLQYSNTSYSYFSFLFKRLKKIFPIYWICLLFGILVYVYKQKMLDSKTTFIWEITIREWFCSITGTCAFWGWWGGPFLTTSWFIGLIVSFYLLFPWLSRFIKTRTIIGMVFIFIISLITHLIIATHWLALGYRPEQWFPLARLFEFSLGIYIALKTDRSLWLKIDSYLPFNKFWSLCGEISFPLFLVHYPLLFTIGIFQTALPNLLSICTYLLFSLAISYVVLQLPKIISNQLKNNFETG